MTDRDRLIELCNKKINTMKFNNSDHWFDFHERISEMVGYLIANGVIVPPCGLNQTLWRITWNNRVEQCKVSSITQKADGSLKIRITPPSKAVFEITVDEIGKTVFLTKEEAEAELKKRGK